jgi:hypothetical protein
MPMKYTRHCKHNDDTHKHIHITTEEHLLLFFHLADRIKYRPHRHYMLARKPPNA